jgi:AraC-like DNA-binding protein
MALSLRGNCVTDPAHLDIEEGGMEGEVGFHHVAPDLWVLEARRCAHRWVVFHETYSFCLVNRFRSPTPRVEWRYNHRLYVADPGHLIMAMQPGELHANVERTPPADFMVLQIGEALMRRVAHDLGCDLSQLDIKQTHNGFSHPAFVAALRWFRAGLCQTLFRTRPGGAPGICTCARRSNRHQESLTGVVSAFIEHYVENGRLQAAPARGAAVLRKAKDYLRERFDEPYDLSRLADAARCNRFYLSHLFKRELGISPSEYRNRILVSRTCEALVKFPDQPLDVIAREVGWSGHTPDRAATDRVSLLIRHFRRTLGTTPGRFRPRAHASARPSTA